MSRVEPDLVVNSTPRIVLDRHPRGEEFTVDTGPAANAADGEQTRTIRHAHLYLTRIDPWSVMKNAFMLSIAIAIVIVVATMIMWAMLTVSGTLASLTRTVDDLAGSGASAVDLAGLLSFGRVFTIMLGVAVMEVILVSALATLFAYLYNLAVAITGGLQVTLTEDN